MFWINIFYTKQKLLINILAWWTFWTENVFKIHDAHATEIAYKKKCVHKGSL